ncbi:unnamed protein product [Caenorhabditis nigoni]
MKLIVQWCEKHKDEETWAYDYDAPTSMTLLELPHALRRHRRSHRRRIQIQNPRRHLPEVKPKECGLMEKAPELEKFENVAGWERSDSFEAVYGDVEQEDHVSLEEKSAKDPSTCLHQKHLRPMPITAFSTENTSLLPPNLQKSQCTVHDEPNENQNEWISRKGNLLPYLVSYFRWKMYPDMRMESLIWLQTLLSGLPMGMVIGGLVERKLNTFQCIWRIKVVKKPENKDSSTNMQHD